MGDWLQDRCNSIQKAQQEHIQKSLGTDIEKGGEGSRGGKVVGHTASGKPIYERGDYVSHYNPITKVTTKGRIHSEDKDKKYHHIRTTIGNLAYVESKYTKHADEKEKEKIHKQMNAGTFAGGKTYNHEFEDKK